LEDLLPLAFVAGVPDNAWLGYITVLFWGKSFPEEADPNPAVTLVEPKREYAPNYPWEKMYRKLKGTVSSGCRHQKCKIDFK